MAQDAALASAAFEEGQTPVDLQEDAALAAQAISPLSIATNMSFGVPAEGFPLDGSSTLTSFIDWSTEAQRVLYVVAGNEVTKSGAVPTDNYNGITVASSGTADDGVYRRVSHANVYDDSVDAVGTRTSTDILAPGDLVDVAGANHLMPSVMASTGTSFAAPHVTGTLALLDQRATTLAGHQHLTQKAVILNSADKIKGIIGMDRTVLKFSNGPDKSAPTWFSSDAASDPTIPLDREIGVGELDASRAIQQFDGGKQGAGSVGLRGWDYSLADDPFGPTPYTLTLKKGNYVSATLVWDRDVQLDSGADEYQRGDTFTDFGFEDLNLYLVPAGMDRSHAVAKSISTAFNLEHIFAPVPSDGDYTLLVALDEFEGGPVNYALAWWAGADARSAGGDFNHDGHVDAQDYNVWQSSFGSSVDTGTGADGNGNGVIDAADYVVWRSNLSAASSGSSLAAVPEPRGLLLMASIVCGVYVKRLRRRAS